MELYNDCGIEHMKTMEPNSVDLFVLDLPYANKKFGRCTAMGWDTPIDLDEMWVQIKRIMKPSAVIVHFCNVKFGYALIHSNPKWFRYDLIWKKSRKVGFLSANKQPLRQHENIYLFKPGTGTYNPQKTAGKPYTHTGRTSVSMYGDNPVPTPTINETGDRHPVSVIDHENMYVFKEGAGTYNPQMTEGKPYDLTKTQKPHMKITGKDTTNDSYYWKPTPNEGTRHPTSIVDTEPDHENMYVFKEGAGTYNPQKTEGKPYIRDRKGHTKEKSCYGGIERGEDIKINTGDRHPTSIVDAEPDHENMYVFTERAPADMTDNPNSTYNPQKTPGKPYKTGGTGEARESCVYDTRFKNVEIVNKGDRHPTSIVDAEPDHENMYVFKKEAGTYNPQKVPGKPYIDKRTNNQRQNIYGDKVVNKYTINTGDRHPTSIVENTILEHSNPSKSIHKTQKPVSLLEWLIKSYSNEGDVVMDFCMGSGTAAVACLNTKRNFIGVERDEEIFNLASNRIENHEIKNST